MIAAKSMLARLCSTKYRNRFLGRPLSASHSTGALGSHTMLRTSILLCTASAAALSLVESPAVNDYELVATGKDCPQDGRINLPCGNCGPNVSVALTRTIFRTLLRTAHALAWSV
jgi:hypothetical protein